VIGRFPWDPFPQGEPEPTGDDPLLSAVYRAAVQGGDAYRGVRSALRREQGVLRVGNRFVPDGRYREVAFVALGRAANSMALAALHVFGDRLTQGFLASPEEPPAALPFRSATVGDGWGGDAAATEIIGATREIAESLRESDLFLLLLSPGALRSLLLPPPGMEPRQFSELLRTLHEGGTSGAYVGAVARVLGDGGVGGQLLPASLSADLQCLIVDRGGGPLSVGGGPTFPVTVPERMQARAALQEAGLFDHLSSAAAGRLDAAALPDSGPQRRPVVVASPADALRASADLAFDKGWTARLGVLGLNEPPAAAAQRFLASVDTVVASERLGEGSRSKGVVVFATTTLDLPEGVAERGACEEFLACTRAALRRREMSVGLFRTSGPTVARTDFAGGAVGAPGEPNSRAPPDAVRAIRMRTGITDVGMIAAALVPSPPEGRAGAARSPR
jgi:glycerate-2-kinase